MLSILTRLNFCRLVKGFSKSDKKGIQRHHFDIIQGITSGVAHLREIESYLS